MGNGEIPVTSDVFKVFYSLQLEFINLLTYYYYVASYKENAKL